MSSVSLFEQLTSSVSLSMVAIVSLVTLAVILSYTVACRFIFSSSTKSKSRSSSKQSSNKDKKIKETNTKKQQQQADTTSSTKKKSNNKTKKSASAAPSPPVKSTVTSSSTSSQSEESEDEKVNLVQPTKKPTTINKTSTGKKVATTDENTKSTVSANETKTKQQQQQQAHGRNENADVDTKKKQSKPVGTSVPNKQQTAGKNDTTNKVNTNTSNKKQPIATISDAKRTLDDDKVGSDQEDEGQWVTQGSKQVSNRNRNKGKNETSNQESVPAVSSTNRKTTSEKRTAPSTSSNNISSLTNKTEVNVDDLITSTASNPSPSQPQIQEPIEICQLLSTSENRYTASDDWWKQALNKQQTFSIDDIGEWPEREQEEQYITNIKRIVPIKNTIDNNNNKTALSEKDINIDGNNDINSYKNGKEDEKINFDEQTNSSSIVTGEASQSKKKSRNTRRLS